MGELTKGSMRKSYKRYARKGKRFMDKKYSGWDMAKKALDGVWYLKGLVNAERKFHDIDTNFTTSSAGTLTRLTNVAQGDTQSTRTGNSLFIRTLYTRGRIAMNTAVAEATVRLILLIDKSETTAAPAVGDILQTIGTGSAPFSSLEITNMGRFKILKSKMFTLNNTGANSLPYKFFIRLRHHTRYNGPLSTDFGRGQIYLLAISDQGVSLPSVSIYNRASYYDN